MSSSNNSLNQSFRLIWSDALQTWVPVSELVSAKGKRSRGGAALKAAAALLASGMMLAHAPQDALAQASTASKIATENPNGVLVDGKVMIDGKLGGGFIVTGDERFSNAIASMTVGSDAASTLVHNFNTVGGAGSGGGAGLGGAFFVDTGASLTVINTDFKSNRVQGGSGGSAPAVSYTDQLLNITGAKVDLDALPVTKVNFLSDSGVFIGLERRVGLSNSVSYEISKLSIDRDTASLIARDAITVFSNYGGVQSSVKAKTSDMVEFSSAISVTPLSLVAAVANETPSPVFVDPVKQQAANNPTFNYGGTTGFTLPSSQRLTVNYGFTKEETTESETLPDDPSKSVEIKKYFPRAVDLPKLGEVNLGDRVFVVSGTSYQAAKVIEVVRFSPAEDEAAGARNTLVGKIKEIVVDVPIFDASTIGSIEIIKAPSFDVVPFKVSEIDRKLITTYRPANSTPLVVGMSVVWQENDADVTARVESINSTTGVVTLSKAVPAGVTSLNFVENPLTSDNAIRISGDVGRFKVGQIVYVPSTDQEVFVGTVTAVDPVTKVVTVSPKNSGQKLSDYYDPSLGVGLRIPAATVGGGGTTITVPYLTEGKSSSSIQSLLQGRLVTGGSFEDGTSVSSVVVGNGTVTLSLSKAVSNSDGIVESFKLASPLTDGGSMNGLVSTFGKGANGTRGFSANGVSSFFNDAEGVDGTNGKSASENTGGAGSRGGDGGDGSNGLPFNFWLAYDVTVAGIQLKQAIRTLVVSVDDLALKAAGLSTAIQKAIAESIPDIPVGLGGTVPNPAKITAASAEVADEAQELRLATKNLINAQFDLGWAIADLTLATVNLGKWATEVGLGLAGLGGAGGDGGEASGGADFFGGGAGGNGGNGGAGAYAINDGGDGGSGGRGGDGGFGAGGGQGGAGGNGGANGNAAGGDPGDGGFAGFGAGDGANGNGMFGGGGDGLGGAIFVREGGSLLIKGNSHFELNRVAGGSTTSQFGEAGAAAGTDLFMMKGSNVRLQPGKGNIIQFDGSIGDDSFATNDGYPNAAGDGADIRIGGLGGGGGGLVIFNGENTYSGNTILEGATLTAFDGVGVNAESLIRFNGSGSFTPILNNANLASFNTITSTMTLDSVGTFLLQENFVRRAGTDPSEVAWTGSGGFASALAEGVQVNLGKLDDEGRGQQLIWGKDGFFVQHETDGTGAAKSGVLTFGSEYSKGSVQFMNNVELDNNTVRIAVYNNGDSDPSYSKATLSGRWVNTGSGSTMIIGDSSPTSPYTGSLFMTGQNALDNLIVAGGIVSTFNESSPTAGKLFKPTSELIVFGDKRRLSPGSSNVLTSSELHLFSDERLSQVSVLLGGRLTTTQGLEVSGNLTNFGELVILGADKVSVDPALIPNYLPMDFDKWNGTLKVGGTLSNYGQVTQAGAVTVDGTLTNAGLWKGLSALSVSTDFTNQASLDLSANLTVNGNLTNSGISTPGAFSPALLVIKGNIGVAKTVTNSGVLTQTGNFNAGIDLINSDSGTFSTTGQVFVGNDLTNSNLLNVVGDVTVGSSNGLGRLLNTGSFSVIGSTSVKESIFNSGAGTVTGNLNVGKNIENSGELAVGSSGSDISVQGSVLNTGKMHLTGTVEVGVDVNNSQDAVLAIIGNSVINGSVTNNGGLQQHGDMSVATLIANNGTWRVSKSASLTAGFLSGVGDFCLSTSTSTDCADGDESALTLNLANNSTFDGVFKGTGSLTKVGSANLQLTEAQQFLGPLTINEGTVQTSGRATLADVVDVVVGTGGTYIVGVADTVRSVTNNGNNSVHLNANFTTTERFVNNGRLVISGGDLAFNNQTQTRELTLNTKGLDGASSGLVEIDSADQKLILNQSEASVYAGTIAGLGSLEKRGDGVLALEGVSTFTGGLTVTAGTVKVTGSGGLADTGTIEVARGATFIADAADKVGAVINSGNYSITAKGPQTVDSFANTSTGVSNLDAALRSDSSVNNAVGGQINQRANISAVGTVTNDGVINLTGARSTTTTGFFGAATGRVNLNSGTDIATIDQSGGSIYAGQINGLGSVVKAGAGNLTLTGANGFTGGLMVRTGGITVTGLGLLADTGAIDVSEGANFTADAVDRVGSVTNSGTYTITARGAQTVASFSNTASGVANLSASLTSDSTVKNSSGGQINQLANITAVGGVTNDGVINVTGARSTTTAGFSGGSTGRVNLNNPADSLNIDQSNSSTYAGQLNGSGSVVKSGVGALTLTGASNFSGGLTVSAGSVNTTGGGTLSDMGRVSVAAGANFIAGTTDTVGAFNNAGSLTVNAELTVPTLTNSGTVELNALLRTTGNSVNNSGTINMAANIESNGKVTNTGFINVQGQQNLKSAGFTGAGTTDIAQDSKLTVQQDSNSSYSGQINGFGSLDKTGAGILTVTNANNSFTGGLGVLAGTLSTEGGGRFADTLDISIGTGATLIAATPDTIRSLTNNGSLGLLTDLSVSSVVNNGELSLDSATRRISTSSFSGSSAGTVFIPDNAKLVIDQSGTSRYQGGFAGTGSLEKTGAGVLTLTRDGGVNLTGGLRITNGTLALDGANILSSSLTVSVDRNTAAGTLGTLQLVSGNQSISQLAGAGVIDLGSNSLTVERGGEFSGEVTGTGQLNVKSGEFTVSRSIVSTNPTSSFVIGGQDGPSGTSKFTLVQNAALSYPTVDVTGSGTLASIAGKLTASKVINVKSSATALNEVANLSLNGGVIDSPLVDVLGGKVTGNGKILGDLNLGANSWLIPGFSPGVIEVRNLRLSSGTALLEIGGVAGSRLAGVTHDQVRVAGDAQLSGNTKLELKALDSSTQPLALGEKVRVFDYGAGKVSGQFASVTADQALGNVAYSLATGNLVGLGTSDQQAFSSQVARYQNQKAMLSQLQVNSVGGVTQFYGGKLLERLAAVPASARGLATDIIFSRSTPETYGAIQDQTKSSLLYSSVDLLSEIESTQRGLSFEYFNRAQRNDGESGFAKFNLRNWGAKLGMADRNNGWGWRVDFAAENTDLRSNDLSGQGRVLSGTGNGFTASIGATRELNSLRNVHLMTKLAAVSHANDLTRRTNDGYSTAKDVGSTGRLASIGLAYLSPSEGTKLRSSFEIFTYQANVDGFVESQNGSEYDRFNVQSQRSSGSGGVLSVSLAGAASPRFDYSVGARVSHFGRQGGVVTSNLVTEATKFTVLSEGLDRTQFMITTGGVVKFGSMRSLQFGFGAFAQGGYQGNVSYRMAY